LIQGRRYTCGLFRLSSFLIFPDFPTASDEGFVYAGEYQAPIFDFGDIDIIKANLSRLAKEPRSQNSDLDIAFCENLACSQCYSNCGRKR
jgi:hypothetical protein